MFKWNKGRQRGKYEVLTLISSKILNFDLHIIYYPPFGEISMHKDIVKGREHHRVNLTLSGEGKFFCKSYKKWWRFIYFRPDLFIHGFLNRNKSRYVLSLGWTKSK